MKIKLSENIKAQRKSRGLTQERLAEILGVTVGAVSKWESGQSTPELGMIVEMAGFFETSVDVLLGYEWHSGCMGESVERIRALRNEKRFDEAGSEAEKALEKYPNSFELVFGCAVMYSMKGIEKKNEQAYQRALGLFRRALELLPQNTNERINEWTISNSIARLYLCMEQTDKALELLKKNNADGVNNGIIGYIIACEKEDADASLPYLSDALTSLIAELYRVMIGFSNAYALQKDYRTAADSLLWMSGLLDGLRQPGVVTHLDKEAVPLSTGCAILAAKRGDMASAEKYLRSALSAAARFDSAPEYSMSGIRFCRGDGSSFAFDDLGATAVDSIRATLDGEDVPQALRDMWAGI